MSADVPRQGSASTPSLKRYWFGLALSIALAVLLAVLGLIAVFSRDLGYGGLLLIMLAIFIGGPLAVALLVTWLVYMGRAHWRLPGRIHVVMFGPTLLALCIVPMAMEMERAEAERFSDVYPAVQEVHVNLSGRPLWLASDVHGTESSGAAPAMPMRPGPWARFVAFTRYPDKEGADAFPYVRSRLRDGINSYTYGTDEERGTSAVAPRTVPLVRMPYPDLYTLTPYVDESSLLVHQYFHYGDHVEVAPGIDLRAVSSEDALIGRVNGLVSFSVSSGIPPAIARLEIDGQNVPLGRDRAIKPDTGCSRQPAGLALVDLGKPLRVRWQTLDDPWHWREASAYVPPYRTLSQGRAASLPSVLLYFMADGRVAAERFQLLELGDQRALHATGLPAGVPTDQACGSAEDDYNLDAVTLLR